MIEIDTMDVCTDCVRGAYGLEHESTEAREAFLSATYVECVPDSEAHFSWSPCLACGCTLGGDRWPVTISWDVDLEGESA